MSFLGKERMGKTNRNSSRRAAGKNLAHLVRNNHGILRAEILDFLGEDETVSLRNVQRDLKRLRKSPEYRWSVQL